MPIFANKFKGRKYKYCAEVTSTPFKDAPRVVTAAIGRLDWAARVALKGAQFDGHNEVLLIGYFAEQGMGVSFQVMKTIVGLSLREYSTMMTAKKVSGRLLCRCRLVVMRL